MFYNDILEGYDSYAGLLLAPEEGFSITIKKFFFYSFGVKKKLIIFLINNSKSGNFKRQQCSYLFSKFQLPSSNGLGLEAF